MTTTDATRKAGLQNVASKALGISLLDFDSDGWLDVFLANDTQPNKLYRNGGDGTFKDVGMTAGLAFGETGVARAGMGTDAGDYDGSGRPSLVVGNFSTEMIALYHNEGNGLFIDEAPAGAIGKTSSLSLTFSCFFFDYDLDGLLDVFAVNGHVSDDIEKVQPKIKYAQPPHLFRNLGGKRFDAVTAAAGAPLSVPIVGRGAAYGDYDNDGDLDLVVTANNGPARLLRNDGGNRNQWLRVKTVGAKANRDGIGARVTVTTPDGKKQWALVKTGSSYASQSELVLTFGLGAATKASKIEVIWPGGATETVADVAAGKTITIAQGKGIVAGRP